MFTVQRPRGLTPFAERVYALLDGHLASGWGAMVAECARMDIDPLHISVDDVRALLIPLGERVARVTDSEHALRFMHELKAVVDTEAAGKPS